VACYYCNRLFALAKLLLANVKFAPQGSMGGFSSQGFGQTSRNDDSVIEGEFEHKEDKKLD